MNKLDGLTLHDLRAVALLADTKHFRKTADILGVSQPSITATIQKVEATLAEPIFHRTSRTCLLTPNGSAILSTIHDILHQADKLEAGIISPIPTGQLNIGVIPTIAPFLLPKIVSNSLKAYPDLKLFATEGKTEHLIELVTTHQLDAAIVSTIPESKDIVKLHLAQDELLLVAPKQHSINYLTPIKSTDLDPAEMLLLDHGNCLRDQAAGTCQGEPAQTITKQSTSIFTLVHFINLGYGYSLIPAMSLAMLDGLTNVAVKSLNPKIYRPINLIVRKRELRIEALMEFAKICSESVSN